MQRRNCRWTHRTTTATATLNSGEILRESTMTHPLLARDGLYAITDGPRADLIEVCAAALDGGATLLQYRDKTHRHRAPACRSASASLRCARITAFRSSSTTTSSSRIAVGAAGVHLGEDDADITIGTCATWRARDHRRVVLRLARGARGASRPRARTISRSARFTRRRRNPTRATRHRRCCARRKRLACRSSRLAASRRRTARR